MNESDKQSRETKTKIAEIFHQLSRFCSHSTQNVNDLVDMLGTRLKMQIAAATTGQEIPILTEEQE